VLRGGRIAAAACFLPLTTNAEVDRTMGTRHRAAIGVTEELDAVALVVSESTQRITVAVGGHLSRELNMPELRQLLMALLNRPPGGADPELPSEEKMQIQPSAEAP
jgi:diadenylate cyclase